MDDATPRSTKSMPSLWNYYRLIKIARMPATKTPLCCPIIPACP